jgi:hypothetical protein
MCDPITATIATIGSSLAAAGSAAGGMSTVAGLSAAAGLAGAGVSAYGQMQSASANKQNLYYQAQVAQNNAKLQQQNADQEMQTGEVQAGNQGLKTAEQVGTTKAGQAASGVDVNSGSSVAVRAGEAELGMVDQGTVLSNASRRAYGFQVGAASDLAQSQLDVAGGKQAGAAGPIAAAGSLLSGAASVGRAYAGWKNATGVPASGTAGVISSAGVDPSQAEWPQNYG